MANMTFGSNILPKDSNVSLGSSDSGKQWTIVSPSLTGTPVAPTATAGTNTTQIATCAFVENELASFDALPEVTSSDNNKVLKVSNGQWAVETLNISDSLSDTSTTNALSAAKGKELNDSITTLNSKIDDVRTLSPYNTFAEAWSSAEDRSDLNGYVIAGAGDSPFTGTCYVHQTRYSDSYGTQIATRATGEEIYYRRKNGSTWSNWNRIDIQNKTITVTGTSSDSRITINSIICVRSGNVVQVYIYAKGDFSSISYKVGDSIIIQLSGLPTPAVAYTYASAINGSNYRATYLDSSGNITYKKITGSDETGSSTSLYTGFTFITNS